MANSVNDFLAKYGVESDESLGHSGVLGMHWGQHKHSKSHTTTKAPPPRTRHNPKKMTDAQLKARLARIKMEQEYAKLTAPQLSAGRKIVNELLVSVAKQQTQTYLNKAVTAGIDSALKSATAGAGRHVLTRK